MEVDLLQIERIPFRFRPIFLPVVISNNHYGDHLMKLRVEFRFPEGELHQTESFERRIAANSVLNTSLEMLGGRRRMAFRKW